MFARPDTRPDHTKSFSARGSTMVIGKETLLLVASQSVGLQPRILTVNFLVPAVANLGRNAQVTERPASTQIPVAREISTPSSKSTQSPLAPKSPFFSVTTAEMFTG